MNAISVLLHIFFSEFIEIICNNYVGAYEQFYFEGVAELQLKQLKKLHVTQARIQGQVSTHTRAASLPDTQLSEILIKNNVLLCWCVITSIYI